MAFLEKVVENFFPWTQGDTEKLRLEAVINNDPHPERLHLYRRGRPVVSNNTGDAPVAEEDHEIDIDLTPYGAAVADLHLADPGDADDAASPTSLLLLRDMGCSRALSKLGDLLLVGLSLTNAFVLLACAIQAYESIPTAEPKGHKSLLYFCVAMVATGAASNIIITALFAGLVKRIYSDYQLAQIFCASLPFAVVLPAVSYFMRLDKHVGRRFLHERLDSSEGFWLARHSLVLLLNLTSTLPQVLLLISFLTSGQHRGPVTSLQIGAIVLSAFTITARFLPLLLWRFPLCCLQERLGRHFSVGRSILLLVSIFAAALFDLSTVCYKVGTLLQPTLPGAHATSWSGLELSGAGITWITTGYIMWGVLLVLTGLSMPQKVIRILWENWVYVGSAFAMALVPPLLLPICFTLKLTPVVVYVAFRMTAEHVVDTRNVTRAIRARRRAATLDRGADDKSEDDEAGPMDPTKSRVSRAPSVERDAVTIMLAGGASSRWREYELRRETIERREAERDPSSAEALAKKNSRNNMIKGSGMEMRGDGEQQAHHHHLHQHATDLHVLDEKEFYDGSSSGGIYDDKLWQVWIGWAKFSLFIFFLAQMANVIAIVVHFAKYVAHSDEDAKLQSYTFFAAMASLGCLALASLGLLVHRWLYPFLHAANVQEQQDLQRNNRFESPTVTEEGVSSSSPPALAPPPPSPAAAAATSSSILARAAPASATAMMVSQPFLNDDSFIDVDALVRDLTYHNQILGKGDRIYPQDSVKTWTDRCMEFTQSFSSMSVVNRERIISPSDSSGGGILRQTTLEALFTSPCTEISRKILNTNTASFTLEFKLTWGGGDVGGVRDEICVGLVDPRYGAEDREAPLYSLGGVSIRFSETSKALPSVMINGATEKVEAVSCPPGSVDAVAIVVENGKVAFELGESGNGGRMQRIECAALGDIVLCGLWRAAVSLSMQGQKAVLVRAERQETLEVEAMSGLSLVPSDDTWVARPSPPPPPPAPARAVNLNQFQQQLVVSPPQTPLGDGGGDGNEARPLALAARDDDEEEGDSSSPTVNNSITPSESVAEQEQQWNPLRSAAAAAAPPAFAPLAGTFESKIVKSRIRAIQMRAAPPRPGGENKESGRMQRELGPVGSVLLWLTIIAVIFGVVVIVLYQGGAQPVTVLFKNLRAAEGSLGSVEQSVHSGGHVAYSTLVSYPWPDCNWSSSSSSSSLGSNSSSSSIVVAAALANATDADRSIIRSCVEPLREQLSHNTSTVCSSVVQSCWFSSVCLAAQRISPCLISRMIQAECASSNKKLRRCPTDPTLLYTEKQLLCSDNSTGYKVFSNPDLLLRGSFSGRRPQLSRDSDLSQQVVVSSTNSHIWLKSSNCWVNIGDSSITFSPYIMLVLMPALEIVGAVIVQLGVLRACYNALHHIFRLLRWFRRTADRCLTRVIDQFTSVARIRSDQTLGWPEAALQRIYSAPLFEIISQRLQQRAHHTAAQREQLPPLEFFHSSELRTPEFLGGVRLCYPGKPYRFVVVGQRRIAVPSMSGQLEMATASIECHKFVPDPDDPTKEKIERVKLVSPSVLSQMFDVPTILPVLRLMWIVSQLVLLIFHTTTVYRRRTELQDPWPVMHTLNFFVCALLNSTVFTSLLFVHLPVLPETAWTLFFVVPLYGAVEESSAPCDECQLLKITDALEPRVLSVHDAASYSTASLAHHLHIGTAQKWLFRFARALFGVVLLAVAAHVIVGSYIFPIVILCTALAAGIVQRIFSRDFVRRQTTILVVLFILRVGITIVVSVAYTSGGNDAALLMEGFGRRSATHGFRETTADVRIDVGKGYLGVISREYSSRSLSCVISRLRDGIEDVTQMLGINPLFSWASS